MSEVQDRIPERFKDRRRDGDTVLRQCQLVELHLLYVLDEVCRRAGLQYFLTGGTLIGAMRHGGFIPWDDDIDVAMLRKDYKKFLSVARDLLPADVILQTPETLPGTRRAFSKLRDVDSFALEPSDEVPTSSPMGLSLDVFPMDSCPWGGAFIHRVSSRVVRFLEAREALSLRKCLRGGVKAVFWSLVGCALGLAKRMVRFFWCVVRMVSPRSAICMPIETPWIREKYRKEEVFPLQRMAFEDGMFPVPADPVRCLERAYGDWQTPPPENHRFSHLAFMEPLRGVSVD